MQRKIILIFGTIKQNAQCDLLNETYLEELRKISNRSFKLDSILFKYH